MAKQRDRFLNLSSVNITMHPHDGNSYFQLLEKTWELRCKAKFRGKEQGTMGRPMSAKRGDVNFVFFPIYKYYDLSPFGMWFNENSQQARESTEENPLADIPEHWKPELEIINCVFVRSGHQIFFDAGKVGPYSAERFFYGLFQDNLLIDEFGPIDVTLVQDREQLERIYQMETLTSLSISIKRPNADDLGADEELIMKRMEGMDAYSWEQTITGQPRRKESIQPDDALKAYMNVALENGSVSAKGYEEEQKVEISTRDTPRKLRVPVSPGIGMTGFIDAVAGILPKWRK